MKTPAQIVSEAAALIADNSSGGITATKLRTVLNDLSDLGSFTQAGTGASTRTVDAKLKDVVSVKDFGAVGDGVTDDTLAFQNARTYVATLAAPSLYIPAGRYKITANANVLPVVSNLEVYGDGMAASVILWQPGSYAGSGAALFAQPTTGRADNVSLRDFAIRGDHDTTGFSQVSFYPILLSHVDNVRIRRVKVSYSRVMGIAVRDGFGVDVSECVVQYCARDGINTADCDYVRITNNRVEFCDDDAIAGHTQNYGVADRGYVISGNIIRLCQGIRMMGARTVTISGNTLEFCMAQGICVDTNAVSGTTQVEGLSAVEGVTITGNTIKNCINRQFVDGLNAGAPYITVSSASAQAGGLAAIPGRNDTATGTIVSPYQYFWTGSGSSFSQPIPDGHNLVISGNVCVRDVYAVNPLSSLGVGVFYTRNGPIDPNLTSAFFVNEAGIRFNAGRFVNALVSGNVFMGMGQGLNFGATAQLVGTTVHGNLFYDMAYGVLVSGSNALHQGCALINNTFNLDPHHVHSNRGSNGTWLAAGDPTGILIQNASGFSIDGNTWRNMARISDKSLVGLSTLQGTALALAGSNFIEGDPAAQGFSTSNKGLGDVPRGPGFVLRAIDSDPASATFGNTLNNCPVAAGGIPTAGKFVSGHIVWNNAPAATGTAGSRYIVLGWQRLTTGSAHLLNTDWTELRCLTGT